MNQKERKQFEKLLKEKRDNLLKEMGLLEESNFNKTMQDASGDISAYSYHIADQASDSQEREKAFHFATREEKYLKRLEEAIERVETKEYGKCFKCGEEIDKKRLEAIPHAKHCIKCKMAMEQKKPA